MFSAPFLKQCPGPPQARPTPPGEAGGRNSAGHTAPGSAHTPPGPPGRSRGRRGTAPPGTGRTARSGPPTRSLLTWLLHPLIFLFFFEKPVDKSTSCCYNHHRCERGSCCAGVAQLVEQLICNQQVGGSNPSTSSTFFRLTEYGGVPKWPKGTDCKSAGFAFDGSNPSSSTRN